MHASNGSTLSESWLARQAWVACCLAQLTEMVDRNGHMTTGNHLHEFERDFEQRRYWFVPLLCLLFHGLMYAAQPVGAAGTANFIRSMWLDLLNIIEAEGSASYEWYAAV